MLNVGLDLRIPSPTLFAMLVLMAVITTFATTPILHLIPRGAIEWPPATASSAEQKRSHEAVMAGA